MDLVMNVVIVVLLVGVKMTEKHSWYKAALRRKKIQEAKRLKALKEQIDYAKGEIIDV
jgi:hypothetical protein